MNIQIRMEDVEEYVFCDFCETEELPEYLLILKDKAFERAEKIDQITLLGKPKHSCAFRADKNAFQHIWTVYAVKNDILEEYKSGERK